MAPVGTRTAAVKELEKGFEFLNFYQLQAQLSAFYAFQVSHLRKQDVWVILLAVRFL